MTKFAIDCAVAAIGEPPSTIRRLGFGPEDAPAADHGPQALVIDCPLCGRATAYPGGSKRGEPALAECDRCDVYFAFDDDEIYFAEAWPAIGELAA